MRFDINLSLVVSVEAFDEDEAREIADRMAGRIEAETEWYVSDQLTGPPPLAVVEEVTPVDA